MSLKDAVERLHPRRIVGALPAAMDELTDDSRGVVAGGGFVALRGAGADGHHYVEKAVSMGARVVFVERDEAVPTDPGETAYVLLDDTRAQLGALARAAYGDPSRVLKVLGVTGTNGKTTTTYLIESLGQALGRSVAVVGTISHRYPGYEESAINTTPGVLKSARFMRDAVAAGAEWLAIEVSSHGVAQERLAGVAFDAGAWTNLSRDHLDFHRSMATYRDAKLRFFTELLPASRDAGKRPWAVANADDAGVREALEEAHTAQQLDGLVWYTLEQVERGPRPRLSATELIHSPAGWRGVLDLDGARAAFELPQVGRFNVSNALAAVGLLWTIGEPLEALASALARVQAVPGRMEALGGAGRPRVYVDFAHTPDALANALETLRGVTEGKLWVVFGAGGDRDQEKRPEMGRVAGAMADRVVVTNDNPRTEDPATIAASVVNGMAEEAREAVLVELDRRVAVRYAITQAGPMDVVLVAGKGHEPYQIIGTTRHTMDDRELVGDALTHWRERVVRPRSLPGSSRATRHGATVLSGMHPGGLAAATGGTLVAAGHARSVGPICTDSRKVNAGDTFWALEGERFDGHRFLEQAVSAGASGLVVRSGWAATAGSGEGVFGLADVPDFVFVVEVDDTTWALGELASEILSRRRAAGGFDVFAITGSNGKTTTKEMLYSVLSAVHPVLKTQGNFNNWIGLPLAVFGLTWRHRYAVLEMGANAPGEIARLCAIAEPEVAIVTSLAPAHLEGFGSLEGVAKAKGEIFTSPRLTHAIVTQGIVAHFPQLAGDLRLRTVGGPGSDVEVLHVTSLGQAITARYGARSGREAAPVLEVEIPLIGAHNAMNFGLVVAAARAAGLGSHALRSGVASLSLPSGRLEVLAYADGIEILQDAYNANPASMRAALAVLSERAAAPHRLVVVGEMRELGTGGEALHETLGEEIAALAPRLLVAVGGRDAQAVARGAERAGMDPASVRVVALEAIAVVVETLRAHLTAGDVVLLKGSRGVALERIVAGLGPHLKHI